MNKIINAIESIGSALGSLGETRFARALMDLCEGALVAATTILLATLVALPVMIIILVFVALFIG